MTATMTAHDFDFQMRVWGWSVWSQEAPRDGLRNPAVTFERGGALCETRWWDRTLCDLLTIERWHGDTRLPVPYWWALCASVYMTKWPEEMADAYSSG